MRRSEIDDAFIILASSHCSKKKPFRSGVAGNGLHQCILERSGCSLRTQRSLCPRCTKGAPPPSSSSLLRCTDSTPSHRGRSQSTCVSSMSPASLGTMRAKACLHVIKLIS